MHRLWLIAGAVLAVTALAFAAYARHVLEGVNFQPYIQITLDTAREMQLVHALALIAVGILTMRPGRHICFNIAGAAFLAGTILFCGIISLSVDPTGQYDTLRPLIPVGGSLLMAGWVAFAIGAFLLKHPAD